MQIIELERGCTRAVIVPRAGGRIHQLSVYDGRRWLPLLLAPDDPATLLDDPLSWGSFPMVPWPGRIDGGRFLWRGRQYALPVDAIDGHALHGRGVYLPWTLDAHTRSSCTMSLALDGAWSFGGRATQHIRLLDNAIIQRIEIHAGPTSFPAGAGWHPWFRRRVRGASIELLVDADRTYETADMIPTGWLPPVTGDRDLRAWTHLGDRRIDDCYQHPRALAVRWGDLTLTMHSSPNVDHAVVYTPSHAVCVEPQTCAPDAFNLAAQGIEGADMAVVRPHRPLIATTTWRWTLTAPPTTND